MAPAPDVVAESDPSARATKRAISFVVASRTWEKISTSSGASPHSSAIAPERALDQPEGVAFLQRPPAVPAKHRGCVDQQDSLHNRVAASRTQARHPARKATQVVQIDGARLFFPDERASELAGALRAFWASPGSCGAV